MSEVEMFHNSIYHRYEGKERLEAGLKKALSEIFKLTKGAPMRSGQLQKYLGLLGNTIATSEVLEGMYISPEGSSERVVDMLHMIGEVAVGFKDSMVYILITLQEYTQY